MAFFFFFFFFLSPEETRTRHGRGTPKKRVSICFLWVSALKQRPRAVTPTALQLRKFIAVLDQSFQWWFHHRKFVVIHPLNMVVKKNMSKHQSVQYGTVHSASYSLAANAKKDIQGLQFPLSKPLELSEDSLDFRLLDLLLSLKSSISHRRLRWYWKTSIFQVLRQWTLYFLWKNVENLWLDFKIPRLATHHIQLLTLTHITNSTNH